MEPHFKKRKYESQPCNQVDEQLNAILAKLENLETKQDLLDLKLNLIGKMLEKHFSQKIDYQTEYIN